jgi:hypothetical protein
MLHLATRCLLLFITRTLYFYGKRRKTEKIVQDPMTDEGNLDVIQISADALPVTIYFQLKCSSLPERVFFFSHLLTFTSL